MGLDQQLGVFSGNIAVLMSFYCHQSIADLTDSCIRIQNLQHTGIGDSHAIGLAGLTIEMSHQ
jgi:hypothetical protein